MIRRAEKNFRNVRRALKTGETSAVRIKTVGESKTEDEIRILGEIRIVGESKIAGESKIGGEIKHATKIGNALGSRWKAAASTRPVGVAAIIAVRAINRLGVGTLVLGREIALSAVRAIRVKREDKRIEADQAMRKWGGRNHLRGLHQCRAADVAAAALAAAVAGGVGAAVDGGVDGSST